MKALLLLSLILSFGNAALASTSATIKAKNLNSDQSVTISLDESGKLVASDGSSEPSIKQFREESTFANQCVSGPASQVNELLTSLVDAANGDGDSWAELVSLEKNSSGQFKVTVMITDEGGENEESFTFPTCR